MINVVICKLDGQSFIPCSPEFSPQINGSPGILKESCKHWVADVAGTPKLEEGWTICPLRILVSAKVLALGPKIIVVISRLPFSFLYVFTFYVHNSLLF